MIKVVKFGGSSLADAKQFQKVSNIIHSDESRVFVVPSAPGKRYDADIKVTDLLYECYELAAAGKNIYEPFLAVKDRYNEIIQGLGLNFSLKDTFDEIENNLLQSPEKDYTASRGEYLNGLIMANFLGYDFIDAADVIFFDEHGNFDAVKTNSILSAELAKHERAVVPGFYGTDFDGKIKTFSRGGSDITGSIVAAACRAVVYENWTDVSGLLMADPHIVSNPAVMKSITYRELRELAYMGASVIHEDAIFPVKKAGIPINIRNTNSPEDSGTWIVENTARRSKYTITGIAGRKNFCSIVIAKDLMHSQPDFYRKVVQCFEEKNIPLEHILSGIDTMTVIVHESRFIEHEQEVLRRITKLAQPESLEVESGISLIAVVGRSMKSQAGTAAKIFSSLADARINVRMIDQGASELNIIVGVLNEDFERAIRSIYHIFVDVI
ncbi:MAG: aspartate kinase [Synergistales bacterium]|nr:aspartate kinase [Synergistales bacterium]MDY6401415.1 aspartate kinase [Synergistales bacterium]MDY6404930.1 aspartate kinase [Synergistales bacterium]MDY6410373.1 aspartate kinase [Synergistales bacterium]MDY6414725.1 aspartate kinase [Synergistales bacterium]